MPRRLRQHLRRTLATRRGVVSVLAMMFLVLFGSLGLAMTIASQGNLRTASTQLHVNKALSAAETGLAVAKARLAEATSRFIVDKGVVDAAYGRKLWAGTLSSGDGQKTVLAPPSGFTENSLPGGLAQALVNVHAADGNTLTVSGLASTPSITSAPTGTDTNVYAASNWVVTAPVAIDGVASSTSQNAAFQITYAPLANGTDVRIIVTGFSSLGAAGSTFAYRTGNAADRSLTRTITQDYRIMKRPRHAVLSPARVLIGKNVQVNGDLASRYTQTTYDHGEPMEVKSDFKGLDPTLDSYLDAFFAGVKQYDVDGDNRLRVNHPTESKGIPNAQTYPQLFAGGGASPFADATGDGMVDDFDIFLNFYGSDDGHGRKRIDLASVHLPDADLAYLIDSGVPDRNRNGVFGYTDTNGNGKWDTGEPLLDDDDRTLGYLDNVIDYKDQYAKIHGSLNFKATQTQWLNDRGDYRNVVTGAIVPNRAGQSPARFGLGDNDVPAIDNSTFSGPQNTLSALATGTFNTQLGAAIGWSATDLANYPASNNVSGQAQYWRADLDNSYVKTQTGRDLWEKMPFNSPAYTDWYIRPRYVNVTFKNVTIPKGNNGLFINCKFLGVTKVDCETGNSNGNWNLYGRLVWSSAAGKPVAATDALDKSDFLRYTSGNVVDGPANYADFPDPPVINGATRTGSARDTRLYSNNIRFHDCQFIGSIVAPTPGVFTHVRNKLQFTGSTRFGPMADGSQEMSDANLTSDNVKEMAKSAMILPNYSVDVGNFNSPTDTYVGGPTAQNVRLQGTIIAGMLDARGNTTIDGSLMLTFAPTAGQGPLSYFGQAVGNPALFNASLGYFGDGDGDGESLDPAALPTEGGVKIVGWDSDGDGIADLAATPRPDQAQINSGAVRAVPFYGYGRMVINWNPALPMPDGIMLPLEAVSVAGTYREGQR